MATPRAGCTVGRGAAAAVLAAFFRKLLRRLARRRLTVALDRNKASFAIGQ
jgi:hypothetical protein